MSSGLLPIPAMPIYGLTGGFGLGGALKSSSAKPFQALRSFKLTGSCPDIVRLVRNECSDTQVVPFAVGMKTNL